MTNEAINSLDDAIRATAKPYLLTRINARLNRPTNSAWEKTSRFIARPAVAFTGLCLVIGINLWIIANNNPSPENTFTANQQFTTDDFSTSVATIFDTENPEP